MSLQRRRRRSFVGFVDSCENIIAVIHFSFETEPMKDKQFAKSAVW